MEIIERTCKPTQCDIYPQYTIMIVGDGDKSYGAHPMDEYYIQMAPGDSSLWYSMNYIVDSLFGTLDELYRNEVFVKELIALMENRERPYTHLADLLRTIKRNG